MVQAMGEARCDEAAVAPGGTNGDLAGLDQEDVSAGVALLGLDCRPQAGEPAPDDEEVAGRVAGRASRAGGRSGVSVQKTAGRAAARAVADHLAVGMEPWRQSCRRTGPVPHTWAAHSRPKTSPTAGAWRVGLVTTRC